MSLSDELARLHELHQRGGLSADEFARAKARLLGPGGPPTGEPPGAGFAALNALRRNASDRWIAGVCGGIAKSTGVESWIWRMLFALLLLFGGVGLVIYLLMWIFVPGE